MKKYVLHICFILNAVLLASCSGGEKGKATNEGEIQYDSEVVDKKHPMAGLAPSKMDVKFKDDMYVSEMSTMGFLNVKFISNPKKNTLTTLVKVLDMKNACIESEREVQAEIDDYKLTFEKSSETKQIAGYKCHKMIATNVKNPSDRFDVWYTKELEVEMPNQTNPYREIDGMLMDFRLKKFGMEMHFSATKVLKKEIQENAFELPGYYKIITKKEMDDFFKSIQ